MQKIVKNTTVADIFHTNSGTNFPASSSVTLTTSSFQSQLFADSQTSTLITSGSFVINDGTSDLTVAQGLALIFNTRAVDANFNNATNSFVSTDVQSAIEEVRGSFSTPSTGQAYYVSKDGSDSTGNGSIGRPYLTIGKAFTQITDSSPTKRYSIFVGPGDYNENLSIKANVFVHGSGPLATKLTGSTININEATWNVASADNRSGFQDISINNVATWDFTAQAGNDSGKLYFYNIRTGAAWTSTAQNAINQMIIQDSQLFGTTTQTGMSVFASGVTWQSGNIVVNSAPSAGIAATFTAVGGKILGNITGTWTSNAAVSLVLSGITISSTTILTATGSSCSVVANDGSLPIPANRTFTGSATLTRINDNYASGLLTATGQVDSASATAPLTGQSYVATSSTAAAWAFPAGTGTVDFGDGSDADPNLSTGTTTLSKTMYYNNLTLSGTAVLDAAGYKIYVKGTLAISGSASIIRTPNNGTAGSGGTNGNGGAAMTNNDMGAGLAGQAGVAGPAGGLGGTTGAPGNNAGTAVGYGAAGGASGSAGSGGTAGAAGTYTNVPERIVRHDHIYLLAYKNGGQGGAGGAGGAAAALGQGGGGGGGGSGGGVIMIFANTFNNTSSVGITCKGGNGAAGGNATAGNSNGGGGGGGGGGGQIYIICAVATAIGTLSVAGGALGAGGVKNGTGSNGGNGSAGSTGHTTVYAAGTNTWTVT